MNQKHALPLLQNELKDLIIGPNSSLSYRSPNDMPTIDSSIGALDCLIYVQSVSSITR